MHAKFESKPLSVLVSLQFVREPPSLPYCAVVCILHVSTISKQKYSGPQNVPGKVYTGDGEQMKHYCTFLTDHLMLGWFATTHCSLSVRFMEAIDSS